MPTKIRPKMTVPSILTADIGGFRRRGAKCFAPRAVRVHPVLQRDVTRLGEGASKVAANVGMGDANQGLGALAQAEPEQIYSTVFGDDPVNMSTRRHHTGSGFQ
jgi:hypothetical protein